MLTFETDQIQGGAAIVEKLVVRRCSFRPHLSLRSRSICRRQNLPFVTVQHRVTTMDAQPSSPEKASIIVLVTGQLIVSSLDYLDARIVLTTSAPDWRRVERLEFQSDLPPRAGRNRKLLCVHPTTVFARFDWN